MAVNVLIVIIWKKFDVKLNSNNIFSLYHYNCAVDSAILLHLELHLNRYSYRP